ncbi:monovalent cation/H+ antiporter subunit D family protein [Aestuariibacter salexigens]|uniref:monovalent cation/H+ antiporter subunit D family protein n=1 Tax=Aestuariibacter salexigens TaxID=226010 RepID=UPI00040CDB38|nr:monovalent cation/H+ antiporter subunit D family protein [Aestuariibacter salexigens]
MMQQISILLVVLPLLAAPITALVRGKNLAWLITFVLTVVCFGISLWILMDVTTGRVIHYELGGWQPPWGIVYTIDSLNALVALIVSGIAAATMLYAPRSVEKEIPDHLIPMFYAMFQLCLLGLLGIALTGDVFNLFVFLEISSLSSYALISLGKNRKALFASFNYLILGTIGATFFLLGVGMLYAASGSLNMADIQTRFAEFENLQLVSTALMFIVVGIALKAAVFPLHSWLPASYSYAPSTVSIFLAATATKVAVYALIRCLFDVFPMQYWLEMLPTIMITLGSVAVIYGSVRAIQQTGMRRLLAYSSVAQIGYMIIGIGLINESGMTSTLLHLFNHALMKAALFMVAGIYLLRANSTELDDLYGLGKDMPYAFSAMVIAGLSLIGVPGTVGFISKWYLLEGAMQTDHWGVVIVILVGSILAIAYVWKLVEALYFAAPQKPRVQNVDSGSDTIAKSPMLMLVATWLIVIANIYFGIDTELSLGAASDAVRSLLGTGA